MLHRELDFHPEFLGHGNHGANMTEIALAILAQTLGHHIEKRYAKPYPGEISALGGKSAQPVPVGRQDLLFAKLVGEPMETEILPYGNKGLASAQGEIASVLLSRT